LRAVFQYLIEVEALSLGRATFLGVLLGVWAVPALAASAPATTSLPTLIVPVSPGCVTSPFGPRIIAGQPIAGTYHWGVDLRAAAGAWVRAVANGRVIRIDRRGMGGLEVAVQHDGFRALYAHLGQVSPALAEGATQVRAGQWIGRIGRTGLTFGTHLYFEIAVDGHRVDPAPYLGVVPCGAGNQASVRPSK
jgi:murein DD-endopeptidase MepM/ murein hydrolase activator NlpD